MFDSSPSDSHSDESSTERFSSDESSGSSDNDEYCGKRSREQFYYTSNTSSDEDSSSDEDDETNYENNNIKKFKLDDYSSPTILILDDNLNNIKCNDYFQLLKNKFAKQQLGKKLWLENRELNYEYIPIEFSKDKEFIMNFIKYHQNKPSQSSYGEYKIDEYIRELCWNQISHELKNDIDMIINFAIYNHEYQSSITSTFGSPEYLTNEHSKIVDNYLNNCQDQDEPIDIIINFIKNKQHITRLATIEKICTFAKNIKTNEKVLLEIFKIKDRAIIFKSIDISLQNDRNFIFKSLSVNFFIFYYLNSKYHDDKEIVIHTIRNLDSLDLQVDSILKIISDRLKIDKDVIIECAKKQIDILQFAKKLLNENSTEIINNREFALQLLEYYGKYLKYFSNEIKNDRELVLLAMKNGGNFTHASEELQNDREIVLESIKHYRVRITIHSCPKKFRTDREIISNVVERHGLSLSHVIDEFKNDKEIVLKAVKQLPYALSYASNELLNDREFIFQLVEQVELIELIFTNDNSNFILEVIEKYNSKVIRIFNRMDNFKDFALKLVKIDGMNLKHVIKDIEIIEEAINQNPLSIIYVNLNNEEDQKKMISKAIEKFNTKYSSSIFKKDLERDLMKKVKDVKLAYQLVKYNPLAIHYLHKYHDNGKVGFKATLLENGYWMKFTENHFQERIIHKYYGAKIENNENEINYYKNRNNGELLWNKNYKWSYW